MNKKKKKPLFKDYKHIGYDDVWFCQNHMTLLINSKSTKNANH